MIRTKCPICGRRHQFRHTAFDCFMDELCKLGIKEVLGEDITKTQTDIRKLIKEYYHKLPIHLKYQRKEKR